MSKLQIFENEDFGNVRIVSVDGEPWIVGKDVAQALGYSNTRDALLRHVDIEDKDCVVNPDGKQGNPNMIIINESGLYSLCLSSKLPTAKKFRRWVTSEVLPSVRKHGAYMTPEKIEEVLLDPDTVIKMAMSLKAERKKRIELETKAEQDKPKVIFADAVASSNTSILIGDLAKLINQNGVKIGGNRLFAWMRNNGYLIKRAGSDWNMPTQRSIDQGLIEIKESTHIHPDGHTIINKTPKITGKGQTYFVNKFLQGEEKHEKKSKK